ncbi:MAG: oxidoreductase [Epulopiscium sp. Nele67-Bin002]|nr:MAG: oxidoreductase [Epulopiscium sp. Nele67-Bin002]
MEGIVKLNNRIGSKIYSMEIEQPEIANLARIGTFINLYPKTASLLLPRPFGISEISKTSITIVYEVVGKGTLEFSGYKPGDIVKTSRPLGNGFTPCYDNATHVLVSGGIGIAPLVELAKHLPGKVIAVMGFKDKSFLVGKMQGIGATTYVASDSGSEGFKGNVVELLKKENIIGDYYYGCGPKPMLKAVSEYCEQINRPIQVSMEGRMGCGYGACVGCSCKVKTADGYTNKKICSDGPVFLGSEIFWE